MSVSAQFYQLQADSCGKAAAASTLDNQRETLLRSQAAWLKLAAREIAVTSARAERDRQRKEEQIDG